MGGQTGMFGVGMGVGGVKKWGGEAAWQKRGPVSMLMRTLVEPQRCQ